jgi:hypothetical protein
MLTEWTSLQEILVAPDHSRLTRLNASRKVVAPLSPMVLWLRLCAVGVAVFAVVIGGRVMIALSAPVDALVAVVAVMMFAYHFER